MSELIGTVENVLSKVILELGYELAEVQFEKQFDEMALTVFIDSETGISLDDCEKVHKAIDPILDELDPTKGAPYILNVSSYGLDRPIEKERDYKKYQGKEIEIHLNTALNGKKKLTGTLESHDENVVTIKEKDKILNIDKKLISKILPYIKF